jgi:hypothetical protein
MDATIDRVGYKRKATDNFAAEARKQDNELGLGVQKNTRGQPSEELTQCDYSKTLHYT